MPPRRAFGASCSEILAVGRPVVAAVVVVPALSAELAITVRIVIGPAVENVIVTVAGGSLLASALPGQHRVVTAVIKLRGLPAVSMTLGLVRLFVRIGRIVTIWLAIRLFTIRLLAISRLLRRVTPGSQVLHPGWPNGGYVFFSGRFMRGVLIMRIMPGRLRLLFTSEIREWIGLPDQSRPVRPAGRSRLAAGQCGIDPGCSRRPPETVCRDTGSPLRCCIPFGKAPRPSFKRSDHYSHCRHPFPAAVKSPNYRISSGAWTPSTARPEARTETTP